MAASRARRPGPALLSPPRSRPDRRSRASLAKGLMGVNRADLLTTGQNRCLRRGRSGSGMNGASRASAGRFVVRVGSCHPVCRRPRQAIAGQASGAQVVRPAGRSTWAPEACPAITPCGSTADGMTALGLRLQHLPAQGVKSHRSLDQLPPRHAPCQLHTLKFRHLGMSTFWLTKRVCRLRDGS